MAVDPAPVEPHARQRSSVTWPDCVCGDPASRHDLTSDDPPREGWPDAIEPCEIDGCGCQQYERAVSTGENPIDGGDR